MIDIDVLRDILTDHELCWKQKEELEKAITVLERQTPQCRTCKYFHKLKQLKDGEWVVGSVCTLWPQTDKGYDAFAIVTTPTDMCECWEYRGDDLD